MGICKSDLNSVPAWRTQGKRILWLRDADDEAELYVAQPAPGGVDDQFCAWIETDHDDEGRSSRPRIWLPGQSLDEMIGADEMFQADILDVDPLYAERIAKLAAEVARESDSWNHPTKPHWSWTWQRTLHYGIAMPVQLNASEEYETLTKDLLMERLKGWHAAIAAMGNLRMQSAGSTASVGLPDEWADVIALPPRRSVH